MLHCQQIVFALVFHVFELRFEDFNLLVFFLQLALVAVRKQLGFMVQLIVFVLQFHNLDFSVHLCPLKVLSQVSQFVLKLNIVLLKLLDVHIARLGICHVEVITSFANNLADCLGQQDLVAREHRGFRTDVVHFKRSQSIPNLVQRVILAVLDISTNDL